MSKSPKLRFKEFSGDWESKKLGELDVLLVRGPFGSALKKDIMVPKSDDTYKVYEQKHAIQKDSTLGTYYITKDKYEELKRFSVEPGDYIMSCSGTIGELYKIPNDAEQGVINQALLKIRIGRTLDENYFSYIFKHDLKNLETKGSGIKNVTSIKFLKDEFDIPVPSKEEQEKIASFFSLIDDKISLQGEKVEALKDYKTGMMQKIFSRELRFKDDEGRDYPEWEHKKLNRIVERITRKNKGTICTLPLTISAQYGLVDQVTFFNKTVASANLEGYYLLEKGEFAYNKSYSTGYPFGAIKRLDRYDRGVLSSLYICFSILEGVDSDFLVQYFETSCWHKEISMIAVEGARNHGLLNISVSDFFETYHWIPCYDEQVKIGEFLGKIDEKINKEQDMLDSLNEYKKGLLQQMFV